MNKLIKRSFNAIGLEIHKAGFRPVLDLTEEDIDPISACYLARAHPVLIRFPLENCVYENLMAFTCDRSSNSPYIRSLEEYRDGKCTSYEGSWLERVHNTFHPMSAADLMGIEDPACEMLSGIPARGALLPWDKLTPHEQYKNKMSMLEAENVEHGLHLGHAHGDKFFGPCSKQKGELEYGRLINVYNSIERLGYRSDLHNNDAILGIYMVSNQNRARMLINNGQHRIAALSVLRNKYVNIQIATHVFGGVIRREDADFWPTVRSRYLTRYEALEMFDRIIDGRQPIAYERAMAKDQS
jgi:hypothetical protein